MPAVRHNDKIGLGCTVYGPFWSYASRVNGRLKVSGRPVKPDVERKGFKPLTTMALIGMSYILMRAVVAYLHDRIDNFPRRPKTNGERYG